MSGRAGSGSIRVAKQKSIDALGFISGFSLNFYFMQEAIMSNPKFITRGGEQIYKQPFDAKGVQFYGFIFPTDEQAIQTRLCDRYFNQPFSNATDLTPLGPWSLLVFNNLASLASTEKPDSDKGWFSERESAIWVPLWDNKRSKPYWFLPYILVDNSYALCMGRETYGFPKSVGQFNISYFPHQSSYFSADTIVVPDYTSVTQGHWSRLWQATRSDESFETEGFNLSLDAAGFIKGVIDAAEDQVQWGTNIEKVIALLVDFIKGAVPMIFLKQFPSVSNPNEAAYQALTDVTIQRTGFHGACLLSGKYQIEISQYDSHPIHTDLGLTSQPIKPLVSFYANLDFNIGNGSVLAQNS